MKKFGFTLLAAAAILSAFAFTASRKSAAKAGCTLTEDMAIRLARQECRVPQGAGRYAAYLAPSLPCENGTGCFKVYGVVIEFDCPPNLDPAACMPRMPIGVATVQENCDGVITVTCNN